MRPAEKSSLKQSVLLLLLGMMLGRGGGQGGGGEEAGWPVMHTHKRLATQTLIYTNPAQPCRVKKLYIKAYHSHPAGQ